MDIDRELLLGIQGLNFVRRKVNRHQSPDFESSRTSYLVIEIAYLGTLELLRSQLQMLLL